MQCFILQLNFFSGKGKLDNKYDMNQNFGLVIHGGAGNMLKKI